MVQRRGIIIPMIMVILMWLATSCSQPTTGFETDWVDQSGSQEGEEQPIPTQTDDVVETDEVEEEEVVEEEEQVEEVKEQLFQDPSVDGIFEIADYDTGIDSDAYASARIYYPIPTAENPGPFPATTMSGGYSNTKEDMTWLSQRMATHGFVVIAFTPNNNRTTNPNSWVQGHTGSIEMVVAESNNANSPIFQMVAQDKLGIAGYSMGGAGAIIASNNLGDKIKVTVPFNAYQPVDSEMKAATLYITGSDDGIASPGNVRNTFESLEGPEKAFANLDGSGHLMMVNPSNAEATVVSTYTLSWYHLQMSDRNAYEDYLAGTKNQADIDAGVFANNGYVIQLDP